MLHIKIIAVGKLKERFWSEACAEYLKRLKPFANIEVLEIPDVDPDKCGGELKALSKEASLILKVIEPDANCILLDVAGKEVSSEQIAHSLDDFALQGKNDLVFVIGSSCGVDPSVRNRANARWSFGKITLPHNIARVVLLEQIYRAFKISRGEPYHK